MYNNSRGRGPDYQPHVDTRIYVYKFAYKQYMYGS